MMPPAIVSTGVLARSELESVDKGTQEALERMTRELLARYGPVFIVRERARLREEAEFAWGVRLQRYDHDPGQPDLDR
jgi:hypothetical protein